MAISTCTVPVAEPAPKPARKPRCELPEHAMRLLEQPFCSIDEAADFLGVGKSGAYVMAADYRERTANELGRVDDDLEGQARIMAIMRSRRPRDVAKIQKILEPKWRGGSWAEIPNVKHLGVIRVRTDLLVPMVYPEAGWPW